MRAVKISRGDQFKDCFGDIWTALNDARYSHEMVRVQNLNDPKGTIKKRRPDDLLNNFTPIDPTANAEPIAPNGITQTAEAFEDAKKVNDVQQKTAAQKALDRMKWRQMRNEENDRIRAKRYAEAKSLVEQKPIDNEQSRVTVDGGYLCPSCNIIQPPQSIDTMAIKNGGVCQMCQFVKNCSDDSADLPCSSKKDTPNPKGEPFPEVNGQTYINFDFFPSAFPKKLEGPDQTANGILAQSVRVMGERGKSYDKEGRAAERSMPQIVAAFEAVTGIKLTAAQGNKFMICVKLVRSEKGEDQADNYVDGAAYFALAGEAALSE